MTGRPKSESARHANGIATAGAAPPGAARRLLPPLLLTLAAGPWACRSSPTTTSDPALPTHILLRADSEEILAGGEVWLTIDEAVSLPDRPDLHWVASGGTLVVSEEGRSARVRFDQPGEYRVSATLFDHEGIVDTHTMIISVRPGRAGR